MKVFINATGVEYTTDGQQLRLNAGIEQILLEVNSYTAQWYPTYAANHPNIPLYANGKVILLAGGRKSLVKELTAHPLPFVPPPPRRPGLLQRDQADGG